MQVCKYVCVYVRYVGGGSKGMGRAEERERAVGGRVQAFRRRGGWDCGRVQRNVSLSWFCRSVCVCATRGVYVSAWAGGGGRWGTGAAGSWHSARHEHGRGLHSVWRATCSSVLEQHCATCTPSSTALPSPPLPPYPLPKTLPRPTELPVLAAHPRPRTLAVFCGHGTLPSSSSPPRRT